MKNHIMFALFLAVMASIYNTGCARKGSVALKVGDTVTFGHYEQDNDTSNGKEPIVWRILDINSSGQYFIVSEKILDAKAYDTTEFLITYKISTIRSWLNGYDASYNKARESYTSDNFIDTAFTAAEKAKIVSANVPAHADSSVGTARDNATTDRIFLLSDDDAEKYFTTDAVRVANATPYAVERGAYVEGSSSCDDKDKGPCTDDHCHTLWWLQSPSGRSGSAAIVSTKGTVHSLGFYLPNEANGVRPAMWIQY